MRDVPWWACGFLLGTVPTPALTLYYGAESNIFLGMPRVNYSKLNRSGAQTIFPSAENSLLTSLICTHKSDLYSKCAHLLDSLIDPCHPVCMSPHP
ncbi:hypothetical protein F4777DRAFT_455666 [Nemania sp. FL0916]|nr:hypothetical protein F4777DRAFT_455666 [Nemania sp. FL0916]